MNKKINQIQWEKLSKIPQKILAYSDDSFFRESWADWIEISNAPYVDLFNHALLLIKPEAVAGHLCRKILGEVNRRGFISIYAQDFAFTHLHYHTLWRYQLRRSTLEKIDLYSSWANGLPAILVLLTRDENVSRPVSIQLKEEKGSALIQKRSGHDIRTYLESPNSILNFIHSSDEPADIIREIGICLNFSKRQKFLERIAGGNLEDPKRLIDNVISNAEGGISKHHLNPARSGTQIVKILNQKKHLIPNYDALSQHLNNVISHKENLCITRLTRGLHKHLYKEDYMDFFVFGSQHILKDIVGKQGEIDQDPSPLW